VQALRETSADDGGDSSSNQGLDDVRHLLALARAALAADPIPSLVLHEHDGALGHAEVVQLANEREHLEWGQS